MNRREQSVDRSGTGGQYTFTHQRIEFKVPMALHGFDQIGQNRFQSLAADPVRCFPGNDQGLTNCFIVNPPSIRL
jgi:hypothetical protein